MTDNTQLMIRNDRAGKEKKSKSAHQTTIIIVKKNEKNMHLKLSHPSLYSAVGAAVVR